ncbi:TPA: response regulator transcription factor [Streptococcus suis]|nr:response regulator transcription factor [Streptococcus suis]HEM4698177.1 response regulator transcription factor [Streptococcus suis]HEM4702125.1 response regulator transcription factor [Streptococcus suis]HEM4702318.1 response regulator transcription factor [Streptococcus suis]
MLNIFILEDDFFQQSRLEKAIKNGIVRNNLKYRHIAIFGKPHQLLESIKEKGNHQIFFLDIQIKEETKKGLDVAKQIRELDPNAVILFVTTHSEFMPLTYRYKVSALDFIDKTMNDTELQEAIDSVLVYTYENISHTVSENAFVFKNTNSHIQVPFSDILYFETSPTIHKIILTLKTGHMEFYGKVSDIAKADDRLYQCHRSYVVNPENVVEVDRSNGTVHFENGEVCYVSRLKVRGLIDRIEKK